MSETKRCPYCGGEILAAAKKCKHCNQWLIQEHVATQSVTPSGPPVPPSPSTVASVGEGASESAPINHPATHVGCTMPAVLRNILINFSFILIGAVLAIAMYISEEGIEPLLHFAIYMVGALLFWLGVIRLIAGSGDSNESRSRIVTAVSILISLVALAVSVRFQTHWFEWSFLYYYGEYLHIYFLSVTSVIAFGVAAVINYFFLTKTNKN